MKKLIVSTLVICAALAACNKDKKPATTEPTAATAGSASDSTKTDPANATAPAKPDETKPATGGW